MKEPQVREVKEVLSSAGGSVTGAIFAVSGPGRQPVRHEALEAASGCMRVLLAPVAKPLVPDFRYMRVLVPESGHMRVRRTHFSEIRHRFTHLTGIRHQGL